MNTRKTLDALEQACKELGVKLAYADLKSEGGLCRLRDSWHLILNRRLSTESRIRLIREALAQVSASGPLPKAQTAPTRTAEEASTETAVAVEPQQTPEPVPAQV
ncbi:MAG: hypothetical protein ABIK86_03035 [candidate division WOR-3 bacterium]